MTCRLTFMAMALGMLVWAPGMTASMGWQRFAKHTPLAICLMIFFAAPTVGAVINTASAGICGAFWACFNIFMLRGFFSRRREAWHGTLVHGVHGWMDGSCPL